MNTLTQTHCDLWFKGQEFGHVMLSYHRYVHHLQSIAIIDVLESIEDKTELPPLLLTDVLDDIQGCRNTFSTEFALAKVHEMLVGGSIVQLSSFYQTVGKKNAACETCKTSLRSLPTLASSFNTLQAAVYAVLEIAYQKRSKGTSKSRYTVCI